MAEMVEVFKKLQSLQEILSDKYALQAEIDETPKRLSLDEEYLARIKQEFITTNASYDDIRSTVGKLKVELAEADILRERSEKGMDNITTHREYEALEKEINDAKEKEQAIRKELEIKEKSLAEYNEKLKNDEEAIKEKEAELNESRASLNNEIAGAKEKLGNLESEEDALEKEITSLLNNDSEIIFKFKRIVKSKHNKGIVAVRGNVCEGCHMILPNQFANNVRNGDEIVFCPYCSRILYYEEIDNEKEQFSTINDTGSLSDIDDFSDDEGFDDDEDFDGEERESIKELDF